MDVQSVSSFFPHCALPSVVILSGVEGSLSIRFKHGHAMEFLPPAQSIVETPWQAHDAARGIGIDIDVLSEEMIAARVRIFVGGLRAATSAKSVRVQSGGKVLVTNGHNWRPRSTPAVFGSWKPLTWTRRWDGGERLPSLVGRRSRYVRFTEGRPDINERFIHFPCFRQHRAT